MPWLWRKFALDAVTLKGKYIYFRNVSKLSEIGLTALLFHEGFHAASQRKIGWTRYALRYALSPSFRLDEEIEAYLRQIEYKCIAVGIASARALASRVPDMLADGYLLKSHREEITRKINAGLTAIITGDRHIVADMLVSYRLTEGTNGTN
jgi:hypothetical protein